MVRADSLLFGLLVIFGLGFAGWFALLSPSARLRRRRRKSHSRIISKGRRPMVRFSVRPPKGK